MSADVELMKLEEQKKNVILAYVLWWFLGFFGAHRFYMGKSHGVTMLVITLLSFLTAVIFIGYIGILAMFVWWIIDAFNIHKWVSIYNLELINNYEQNTASTNS